MAFFSVDGIISRSMWPKTLVGDQGTPRLENWRVLPTAMEALEERISIEGASSPSPRVLLTHPQLEEQCEFKEMKLRVQGIVGDINVKVLGNWSEKEDHAPKAVQYVTLVATGQGSAFAVQRDGILHLEELIMASLSEQFVGDLTRNGAINLRRRVFHRVHPCDDVKSIALTSREDPGAKARKLNSQWVVDHRIKVGIQDNNGKVTIASPLSIHRGDFVDIAANVEIIRIRGRFTRRTEVMLCPSEIVRLRSASEVNGILRPARPVSPKKIIETPTVSVVASGFAFGEVEERRNDTEADEMDIA